MCTLHYIYTYIYTHPASVAVANTIADPLSQRRNEATKELPAMIADPYLKAEINVSSHICYNVRRENYPGFLCSCVKESQRQNKMDN